MTAIEARKELIEFAKRTGRGRAWLASSRLVILPHWFMRRFGGAAAIWRWTCISRELVDNAPADVRRAVIAHEWGHAYSGHCVATIGSLVLALCYAVSSTMSAGSIPWGLANIAMLAAIGTMLLWALHPKREFEADSIAVSLVGSAAMAAALRWIVDNVKDGQMPEAVANRLERLDGQTIKAHA